MVVKMILREIGEDGAGKVQPLDAVLVERMGGDLHHAPVTALAHHARKELLQRHGVGRCVVGLLRLISHHVDNGAHKTHLVALAFQHMLHDEGG